MGKGENFRAKMLLGLYAGMLGSMESPLYECDSITGRRTKEEPKKCIMCGEPRSDGLFCDGSKPFLEGKSCKEVYRSEPEYWDKTCKY